MSNLTEAVPILLVLLNSLILASLIKAYQNGRELHNLKTSVDGSMAQLVSATMKSAHAEGVVAGGDVARALGVIATAVAVRENAIAISLEDVAKHAAEQKAGTDAVG